MTDQPCQTAVNSDTLRAMLRREKIAARMSLAAAEHNSASVAIRDQLAEFLLPLSTGTIAFCMPIRAEVDCRPLVQNLLTAGWQAAIPVVRKIDAPMEFHSWTPDAPMTVDPYGIPIPAAGRPVHPDVVLLPLVAFDAAGYRLGYGGGYFDRTLASMQPCPLTIGVGFDLGAVKDIRPERHDVPLDLVVTESGIRRINRR